MREVDRLLADRALVQIVYEAPRSALAQQPYAGPAWHAR
jgi:hypothetical protein